MDSEKVTVLSLLLSLLGCGQKGNSPKGNNNYSIIVVGVGVKKSKRTEQERCPHYII